MMSKRKPSVELLRIIACFTVVSLHATEDILDISTNNIIDYFIFVVLQNGVSTFWYITGFFIFNSDYKNLLKKTFKKIWLPTFIVSVVCVVAYDLYLNIAFGTEFKSVFAYAIDFLYNALRFRTFAPSCKHFWYIYTYCLLVVFYPVIKSFVDYLDGDKKKQKVFVCLSMLVILLNEITQNELADISNHGFSALLMASIEVVIGHILYENKELYIEKISGKLAFILLLVTNMLRSAIYIFLIKNGFVTSICAPWFSIFSIINSALLFIACEKIIYHYEGTRINDKILKIGTLTFGAYMFHKVPIKIFNKMGFAKIINNANELSRYPLMFADFAICFLISLVISFVYNKIIDLFFKNKKTMTVGG